MREVVDLMPEARAALRNEPVQARSTARLTALLDAAASIVDEIGFERLTTAMVAERAGASIGTVYRYFPDRIALLQALSARNLERVLTRTADEIADERHERWPEALDAAFSVLIDAFATEPGYRGLRVGDVIDLRPAVNDRTYNSIIAEQLFDALIARFDIPDTEEARFHFELAIEIADAIAARAFARDPKGDRSFLQAGRDIVYPWLTAHFGPLSQE